MSTQSLILPLISVGNPLIWVHSLEEARFLLDECSALASSQKVSEIYIWDATGRIYNARHLWSPPRDDSGNVIQLDPPMEDVLPVDAISMFCRPSGYRWEEITEQNRYAWSASSHGFPERSILIVLDMPELMVDPSKINHTSGVLTRSIKTGAIDCISQNKSMVFVNHHEKVPIELDHMVSFLTHELPSVKQLRNLVIGVQGAVDDPKIPQMKLTEEQIVTTSMMLRGLTSYQAENVLALANRHNALDILEGTTNVREYKVETIKKEKARAINKSGILEIIEPQRDLDSIGGMQNLKEWVARKEMIFRHEARNDGADIPKGLLIVGPGGTGKSQFAMALAKTWNRTCLRLDISNCMSKWVGDSEGRLLKALKDAEAQAPCILFLDEFEKMFAGAGGGSDSESSGTFQRMYASWLNWAQSKTEDVFVVATTNSLNLPAPALRKGRFDEIFFADLPSEIARQEIFFSHLDRRGWNPEKYCIDVQSLARLTPNRTGAEIEQIVVEGINSKIYELGFGKDKPLTTGFLEKAIERVRTAYELNPGEVQGLRQWAKDRGIIFVDGEENAAVKKPAPIQGKVLEPSSRKIKITEGEL